MDILIYDLIAAVLAWRLYATLGTRHGGERLRGPQSEPQQKPENSADTPAKQKDLLALPLGPQPQRVNALPAWGPAPDSLAGALQAIEAADPTFNERAFVKGARLAFEMIVHAFAAGEEEALKPLMSPVLFEAFHNAIAARQQAGERMDMRLLNVIEAHVSAARLQGRFAFITVEIVSDQARSIYAGDTLKEEGETHRLHDVWTFRREIGHDNPNWMLVETRSAE
ncbi:MAG TPA: Tim44/TimA family putative adaptor protein [Alphaproteobacteria bacterium]|nr:Tim44/TimA family putative adaptor protein [Alphaproteobacteria bacterium]